MSSAVAEATGCNNVGKRIGPPVLPCNKVLRSTRHTVQEIPWHSPTAHAGAVAGKNHRFSTVVAQTALAVKCTQACLGNFLSHR